MTVDTLLLDKRQRAMLAEMGVRVWSPLTQASQGAERAEPSASAASPLAVMASAPTQQNQAQQAAPEADATQATQPDQTAWSPSVPASPTVAASLAARPEGIDQMDWPTLQATVASCQACGLCAGRQNTVFGVGTPAQQGQAPQADWLIVGEAPGENEDLQGEPFVGQAGKLLDNMLAAIQLSRHAAPGPQGAGVYIANVLKCRPPGNRNPRPEEVAQCLPYLEQQVALLQPRIIVAMGRFAVQALLRDTVTDVESTPLGKLRGRVHRYRNVPVVVTYHPAYVLRNLPEKAKVWADLCLAMAQLKGTQ